MSDEHRERWVEILDQEMQKHDRNYSDFKASMIIFANIDLMVGICEDLRKRSATEELPPLEYLPAQFKHFPRLIRLVNEWRNDLEGRRPVKEEPGAASAAKDDACGGESPDPPQAKRRRVKKEAAPEMIDLTSDD